MSSLWCRLSAMVLLVCAMAGPARSFERAEVRLQTASGDRVLHVELAVTAAQRQQGLMGRDALPDDSGMLFVFESDRVATMWMHDTRIVLDLLFLSANGRVVRIAERATPMSDDVISSEQRVHGVLELPGGAVARFGIRSGDRVLHPLFSAP